MVTPFILSEYILSKTNLLAVIINPLGNIEYVSPAVERLLNYSNVELLGNGWWIKTRKEEEAELVKQKILKLFAREDNFIEVYEHELICENGSSKWIRWELSKISDEQIIGIGQDISERKRFENSLKEQVRFLKEKNKNITDSILYAKRLQKFILKQPSKLQKYFTDSFIFYLPKDIISGDYYSFFELKDKYVVVLADCTGHGVPGAMMSFLAHSIIREIIYANHNEKPSDVLYKIDNTLYNLLNNNPDEYCLDGMDIAVVFIDKNKKQLQFSGALRPIYLFNENGLEILECAKYSIGFSDEKKNFFDIERPIRQGDNLYLFSDGYIDQFGGPKDKKLNRKNFIEILNNIQEMNMEEQLSFLEYSLNNWKQQNDQTDDICVIGIKI